MSDIKNLDKEMVSYVEKSNTIEKGSNLLQQTKDIKFNVMDKEMDSLNTALDKAKDTMKMVPQPTSSIGKWFMDKTPKLTVWFMQTIQGREFASGDSLEKIEILMEQMDQTFIRLHQNIEPTKKLQQTIMDRVDEFSAERDRIKQFIEDNPDTPSKDFLQLHVDKLDGTIEVLKNSAIVWLNNNIANRLKMYVTAMTERRQLEVTLVAGINTLKTTQEVKKAAETQDAMRELTNAIQQQAAEANAEMEIAVADVTTKTIFTQATMEKIQKENERALKGVTQTKELNAKENEKLRAMLENYNPQTSDDLDATGAELLKEGIKDEK
jgi:hypothetical protein